MRTRQQKQGERECWHGEGLVHKSTPCFIIIIIILSYRWNYQTTPINYFRTTLDLWYAFLPRVPREHIMWKWSPLDLFLFLWFLYPSSTPLYIFCLSAVIKEHFQGYSSHEDDISLFKKRGYSRIFKWVLESRVLSSPTPTQPNPSLLRGDTYQTLTE